MCRGMPPRWSKSNHVGTGLGMYAAPECVGNKYGVNITNNTWCLFEGFCVASIALHRLHIENDLMYGKVPCYLHFEQWRKWDRHIRQHSHCDIVLITKDCLCLHLLLLQAGNFFSLCMMRTIIFACICIIKYFPLIFYLHIFLSWILHILYNYYSCFLCYSP